MGLFAVVFPLKNGKYNKTLDKITRRHKYTVIIFSDNLIMIQNILRNFSFIITQALLCSSNLIRSKPPKKNDEPVNSFQISNLYDYHNYQSSHPNKKKSQRKVPEEEEN